MTTFDKLINVLPYLGDYNKDKSQITLYNVLNKVPIHEGIKNIINEITTKYKYIILDPKEERTNVKILDIDI
jgi:hypothetical protein